EQDGEQPERVLECGGIAHDTSIVGSTRIVSRRHRAPRTGLTGYGGGEAHARRRLVPAADEETAITGRFGAALFAGVRCAADEAIGALLALAAAQIRRVGGL